jgi:hypothetical protein
MQHAKDPGLASHEEITRSSEVLQFSRSSTADSAIRRGLKNFVLSGKKNTAVEAQDPWGPLGLNLLNSPPDPLIDLIFVHGLRGGSTKTWWKSEDQRLFWPQAWLPRDADLQNARIHSFGYNSDWGGSQDASLDLTDFGRLLFGHLATSPVLQKGKQVISSPSPACMNTGIRKMLTLYQTPILLIGHSMGGLVMMKVPLHRLGPRSWSPCKVSQLTPSVETRRTFWHSKINESKN